MKCIRIALLCVLSMAMCGCSAKREAKDEPSVGLTYVSWATLEADKAAAMWLIKRFIDPEAIFRFVPKQTAITNGIPLDTPDARFRRYHAESCFQSILRHHGVTNASLVRIGKITFDIEVNFWDEKQFAESEPLRRQVIALAETHSNNLDTALQKSMTLFDGLYADFIKDTAGR